MNRLGDGRYRWLVVAYTLVMQAITVGTLIYCFAPFTLPWLEEFDAPRRDVGRRDREDRTREQRLIA